MFSHWQNPIFSCLLWKHQSVDSPSHLSTDFQSHSWQVALLSLSLFKRIQPSPPHPKSDWSALLKTSAFLHLCLQLICCWQWVYFSSCEKQHWWQCHGREVTEWGLWNLQSFLWDWLRLLKSISRVFTAAFTCIFEIKAAVGRFISAVFQTVTWGNKLNVEDKTY